MTDAKMAKMESDMTSKMAKMEADNIKNIKTIGDKIIKMEANNIKNY